MKYLIVILLLVLLTSKGYGQENIYYHYFANGERVKNSKKATFTRKVIEDKNSLKI